MEIKDLSNIKYLGMIYNNKLNWKYHIQHITILVSTFFTVASFGGGHFPPHPLSLADRCRAVYGLVLGLHNIVANR